MLIRDAEPKDIPAILVLYNQAVRSTTAAWTTREETLDERLSWFEERLEKNLPVLVAVSEGNGKSDGDVLGFASYGAFRPREGYRLTAEHTVYVDPRAHRQGIGRALLSRLIDIAEARGVHVLIGGIDGENAASIALHEKLGFEITGRLPQTGTKFGRWLDLVFMSRVLNTMAAPEG